MGPKLRNAGPKAQSSQPTPANAQFPLAPRGRGGVRKPRGGGRRGGRQTRGTGRAAAARVAAAAAANIVSDEEEDELNTALNNVDRRTTNNDSAVWVEPEIRDAEPSYKDTPWSGMSSAHNPFLKDMHPLGTRPSSKELAKADNSLSTAKAKAAKKAAEAAEKAAPTPPRFSYEDVLSALMELPLPKSDDYNVHKLKTAIEDSLALAVEAQNYAVARGLLRLWENSSTDPFLLSVVEANMQNTAGPREQSAFQSLVLAAWKDVLSESPDSSPADGFRPRSASNTSSLSTAKSLDAETFAPSMEPGAAAKGRPLRSMQTRGQKRDLEPDFEELAGDDQELSRKRQRLHKTFPNVVPQQSSMRSYVESSPSSSAASSPEPEAPPSQPPAYQRKTPTTKRNAGANARRNNDENDDWCHICHGGGHVLLCDGCDFSFHHDCLDPPAEKEENDDPWYCPKCGISRSMGEYLDKLKRTSSKDFVFPQDLRNYYMDARSKEDKDHKHAYRATPPLPKFTGREHRGSRDGNYFDSVLYKTEEKVNGVWKPITCFSCKRWADGERPIINCDYCALSFHLDCLDPPMANPPHQIPGSDKTFNNWLCPAHAYHDTVYFTEDENGNTKTHHIRRPRNPRLVDVEVLPDPEESERIEEQAPRGVLYRVRAGKIRDAFVKRIQIEGYRRQLTAHREELRKRAADPRYNENVPFDPRTPSPPPELLPGYQRQPQPEPQPEPESSRESSVESWRELMPQPLPQPRVPEGPPAYLIEDAETTMANSRTPAEREAARNLIAFARAQQANVEPPLQDDPDRINLLIDSLRARAAPNLPPMHTELDAMRALKKLVDSRISHLEAEEGRASIQDMNLD